MAKITNTQRSASSVKWKSFQMPKSVEIDESTLTDTYGKFIVEPLERGFGFTLGNALRRVLLSSIHGSALSAIRIDGIYHEFSTIPGIKEDIPEVVLNLKEVNLKLHEDKFKKIIIEKNGPGELTAADLGVDSQIEVLNPSLHIATLDEDAHFRAEMSISSGRGFMLSEDNRETEQPIGTIVIDAIYSPIRKVNYFVENARVGRQIDFDKLTIEIWTNGAMRPEDALSFAARILRDHLQLFITFEEEFLVEKEEKIDVETERIKSLLKMNVEELELSVRSSNCLKAAGIGTLEDLVQKTEQEMLKYRNFGRKSLSELSNILNNMGLGFGMDVSKYKDKIIEQKEIVTAPLAEESFVMGGE